MEGLQLAAQPGDRVPVHTLRQKGNSNVITNLFKVLLSAVCLGLFFYSASVFGLTVAHLVLPAFALLVLVSMFYRPLAGIVRNLSKYVGALSFAAFVLLMLAGTIGGSFRLSPSNQAIAVMLLGMAFLGLSAFLWSVPGDER